MNLPMRIFIYTLYMNIRMSLFKTHIFSTQYETTSKLNEIKSTLRREECSSHSPSIAFICKIYSFAGMLTASLLAEKKQSYTHSKQTKAFFWFLFFIFYKEEYSLFLERPNCIHILHVCEMQFTFRIMYKISAQVYGKSLCVVIDIQI